MINIMKLKGLMVEKGITQKNIADKCRISERTVNGHFSKKKFGTDEIVVIGELLELSNHELADIFLCKKSL